MVTTAIIEAGGRQFLVTRGSVFTIEKSRLRTTGNTITFDKVLLADDGTTTSIGTPYVQGVMVSAELIGEGRGRKITVIRYRPKSRHFVKRGHRQPYIKVRVTNIT